jgi:dTDP-4-amino-4,6-dideoxygalactose transaminase
MIPRLKPYLGFEEITALFTHMPAAVARFESEFARTFRVRNAIAFPYGRSALWAFFKSLGIENGEVIQPAYSCVVVSHATLLSGNVPRFVDVRLDDYNMDLDQVESTINDRTRAILATHLFGYPLNIDRLQEIVEAAEKRYGHKIWIIQDCAHSFGAQWQGQPVCNAGDVGLFGLNISKMITSIFGGMLTIDDDALAAQVLDWRNTHFHQPGFYKTLRRILYLLAVYPAFNEFLYGFVYWLQEETPLLNMFTKAYHLDELVHFPPDYRERMLNVEARLGLTQLGKYDRILRLRRQHAEYYEQHLRNVPGLELPPIVSGATYSHYVIRVSERQYIMREMARRNVQLGQLIEYSIPHMQAYKTYAVGDEFPNSFYCSAHTINLPVYAQLSTSEREKVVDRLIEVMDNKNAS